MECKKCGASTVEGASFCGKCGARIDGKRPCKACGKLNDEAYDFCVYCGARIDGKTVCASCGNAHAENFCPFCGTAASPAKPTQTAAGKSTFKTVADIIANAATLLGAVLSLIFVCFIGLKLQADGQAEETQGIFYYFGEYWKEIESMKLSQMDTTPWFIDSMTAQLNASGVIGIILAAAVLATTATFAIIAVVKYSVGWAQGKHVNVEGWSLASVISFLIGAVTYYAFNSVSAGSDLGEIGSLLGGADFSGGVQFNDVTVTAIVLLSVCTVVSVVFRMLCEGKALWAKENIAKQTLVLTAVVLSAVAFGVSQSAAFAFALEADGVSLEIGANYIQLSGGITVGMASAFAKTSAKGYAAMTAAVATMNTFSVLAAIFAVALSVFSGLALMGNLRASTGEKDGTLLWSILALASAVLLLAFHIVVISSLTEVFNVAQEISGVTNPERLVTGNYATPIVATVFAVALLVISIIKNKPVKSVAIAENA